MWNCWFCRPRQDEKLMQMIAETQNMQRDLTKCINALLDARNLNDRPDVKCAIRHDSFQDRPDFVSHVKHELTQEPRKNSADRSEKSSASKSTSAPVASDFSASTFPCRKVVKAAPAPIESECKAQDTVNANRRASNPPRAPPPPVASLVQKLNGQPEVARREKSASGLQSALLNEISDATTDIPAFLASARQRRSL